MIGEAGVRSVSYTHLDVYKRQAYGGIGNRVCLVRKWQLHGT